MAIPKLGKSSTKEAMHYSVGAIIKKEDKYLLLNRMKVPLGFASLAGHIDEGENPEEALIREVKEESNLDVLDYSLLIEEEKGNVCSRGIKIHYWYVFECKVSGSIIKNNSEAKSIGWHSKKEIRKLALEPIWEHWFRKLGIIES